MMTRGMEEVLIKMRPGAEWVIEDGVLVWLDADQAEPTTEEMQAYLDDPANFYRESRAAHYPPVSDFADAMVKINSTDEELMRAGEVELARYYAACNAVKKNYPKPV
jgi:hypothetical protein